MNAIRTLIAAIALGFGIPAFASTDCYGTVTVVQYDKTAATLTIALDAGTYFAVALSDADIKHIEAIGIVAKTSGSSVMVRYAASSVSCTSGGRTDMTVFLMQ